MKVNNKTIERSIQDTAKVTRGKILSNCIACERGGTPRRRVGEELKQRCVYGGGEKKRNEDIAEQTLRFILSIIQFIYVNIDFYLSIKRG